MRVPRTQGKSNFPARAIVAALLCALTVVVSGCGGTKEQFTSAEANRALAALAAIQAYVDSGRCSAASSRVNALASQSTHVNRNRPDLGEAYASSVARLKSLVARECVEITPDSPTPETTAATGATGTDNGPTPAEPTGGGTTPPDTPDNGNGTGTGGDTGNGTGGDTGGQNTTPANPPADSGGAGPGA